MIRYHLHSVWLSDCWLCDASILFFCAVALPLLIMIAHTFYLPFVYTLAIIDSPQRPLLSNVSRKNHTNVSATFHFTIVVYVSALGMISIAFVVETLPRKNTHTRAKTKRRTIFIWFKTNIISITVFFLLFSIYLSIQPFIPSIHLYTFDSVVLYT